MRAVFFQFLSLEVLNFDPVIYWALGMVWGLLLVAALASVRSHDIPIAAKLAWLLVIVALPIAGMAFYSVWCLFRANWSFLMPLLQSKSQAVQSVVRSGNGGRR